MTASASLLRLLLIAVTVAADDPAAAYRVGAGDVLEITVAGRPDLARLPTVQTTGGIWLPRLKEVRVEGLTVSEIARKLTGLMARVEPGRPEVGVAVKEYRSQFVWVGGEVNRPGRKAYRGGLRLVDVLLEVGGFTANASGEVVVRRQQGTFPDGSAVQRYRFPRGGPTPDAVAGLQTVLHRDDVVTAALAGYFTLSGAVVRPGRYRLDGDTTLSAAVSSAGGLSGSARRRASLNRRDASGQMQTLRIDLEAVEKGREPDPLLLADDEIDIEARL